MPFSHEYSHFVIPTRQSSNDVEPTLEAIDPFGQEAIDHLIEFHPDIYATIERIAFDQAGGENETKKKLLIVMARLIIFLENR
ncbi:MAG: hypothetical protein R3B12_02700 [Candidatus Saccharimonadales bacterium]